jgi:hypothetical protein
MARSNQVCAVSVERRLAVKSCLILIWERHDLNIVPFGTRSLTDRLTSYDREGS